MLLRQLKRLGKTRIERVKRGKTKAKQISKSGNKMSHEVL